MCTLHDVRRIRKYEHTLNDIIKTVPLSFSLEILVKRVSGQLQPEAILQGKETLAQMVSYVTLGQCDVEGLGS